jgi:predicted enzyme related to lactoylglutathione lyase
LKGNHFHISVRDLETTLSWFERVWQLIPAHKGKTFAVLPFGSIQLVIDASNQDSLATLGFASENCDRDCQSVVERGATVIEQPADRSWGVRVAYVKGPAGLTLEIEQQLGKLQVPEKA